MDITPEDKVLLLAKPELASQFDEMYGAGEVGV
jgi:hypothetical protein